MTEDELNIAFLKAYELSSNFKGKLPQDLMLKLYALFKIGSNEAKINSFQTSQDMVSAFKSNAIFQFSNYEPSECKKMYIELVNQHCI